MAVMTYEFIYKCYIIYTKPLYGQNSHYIGKSTTRGLTYRLVTKSVPCRLDSTYRLQNLEQYRTFSSQQPDGAQAPGPRPQTYHSYYLHKPSSNNRTRIKRGYALYTRTEGV
jgi:hypothetical protein